MNGLSLPKTNPTLNWAEILGAYGPTNYTSVTPTLKPTFDLAETLGAYGPTNYTLVTPEQLDAAQTSLASYTPSTTSTTPSTTSTDPSFLGKVGDWFTNFGQSLRDSGFLGYTDTKTGNKYQGWGMPVINTAFGLGDLYLALKNYGIAKDTLKFQKDAFNKNYAAQRNLINSSLEDRQRRRVQENPNATPVDQYMAKYGVK